MLTAIALIISGVTSFVCIVIAVRQKDDAAYWLKNYQSMREERNRLMEINGNYNFRMTRAKRTLKKVQELVATEDALTAFEEEGDTNGR